MLDFLAALTPLLQKDPRYKADAYLFVMESLGKALKSLKKPRHISGQELLGVIRKNAAQQFGPMADSVFAHWGVKNSLDFGRIVFNMVEGGILSKTETDRLDDFRDLAFFQKLFDQRAGYRLTESELT